MQNGHIFFTTYQKNTNSISVILSVHPFNPLGHCCLTRLFKRKYEAIKTGISRGVVGDLNQKPSMGKVEYKTKRNEMLIVIGNFKED